MKNVAAVLLVAVFLCSPLFRVPVRAQPIAPSTERDGHNDWKFLFGTWRTHYRLLRHRLTHDHVWYSCEGTSVIRPFWVTDGNLEDGDLRCPHRYIGGLTLRLYDAKTHQWSLWWGTRKLGVVPPQQVGEFDAKGVGAFYARDIAEHKHVIVRFRWTHNNGVPHFEQAFSPDNGATWETNWTTDYERVPAATKGIWNVTERGQHGFGFLIGTWHTHDRRLRRPLANDREWYSCEGNVTVRAFWAASGNLEDGDLRCPQQNIRSVTLRVFNASTKRWQLWFGTQNAGLLTPPQVGTFDSRGVGVFLASDMWHGKSIIVRYTWMARRGRPYFERAFSPDGGKTWETNWTTVYTRG